MVGSAVPIAVLALPVWVLAMHWGWPSWGLGAPSTALVLSLDMGEALSVRGGVGSEGQPFISDSHSTFQQGADSEQRGFTR